MMRRRLVGRCASGRQGLSTLEMVLSLPILLMVMALMVNYGTVACWKLRALSVARHALWGSRTPRTGNTNPRPTYWPASAGVDAGGADRVAELDDAMLNHPVVRGPALADMPVNGTLLDPGRGLRRGEATLSRRFPMLGKLGEYHLQAITCLLDDKWQYSQMGLPWNRYRRFPVIYSPAKPPAHLVQAYIAAALAVNHAMGTWPGLWPLDRDDEFLKYYALFGWGSGAPDFHPRLTEFCVLDYVVAGEHVQDLIDRIRGKDQKDASGNTVEHVWGVAETMTRAFLHLYESVIQQLKNRLGTVPPPPPQQVAGMQAEIAQLQAKINILQQFLATF